MNEENLKGNFIIYEDEEWEVVAKLSDTQYRIKSINTDRTETVYANSLKERISSYKEDYKRMTKEILGVIKNPSGYIVTQLQVCDFQKEKSSNIIEYACTTIQEVITLVVMLRAYASKLHENSITVTKITEMGFITVDMDEIMDIIRGDED